MGTFSGIRFEAPDPEPVPKAPQQAETQPRPGADRAPASGAKNDEKDERYEVLNRELQELRTSNRQLVELVGRAVPERKTEPSLTPADIDDIDWGEDEKDEPNEPEDPAALVEDLSKLGPEALAKRGFVRMGDVRKLVREESRRAAATAAKQVVAKTRTEVTRENAVMREFPDLADQESELFKETAARVRRAVAIGADPKNPATLYMAAEAAREALHTKGGRETRGAGREPERAGFDDDFDAEEDEREPVLRERRQPTERDRRIASQQGDRGRGGRSRIQSDGDEFVMSDEAKSVARMMGISDDEYTTEATRVRSAARAGGGRRR